MIGKLKKIYSNLEKKFMFLKYFIFLFERLRGSCVSLMIILAFEMRSILDLRRNVEYVSDIQYRNLCQN